MDRSLWGIMNILGPAILLIALIWLVMRRRSNRITTPPRPARATCTARKSSGGAKELTTSE